MLLRITSYRDTKQPTANRIYSGQGSAVSLGRLYPSVTTDGLGLCCGLHSYDTC
jgi:hypothetical protein